MFVRLFFLLCCLLAISHFVYSQSDETDSLIAKIKSLPDNEDKVKTLLALSGNLTDSGDSTGIGEARKGLWLSRRLTYEKGTGNAYVHLARAYKKQGYFQKSLQMYDSALQYFQSDEDLSDRGNALNQMGILEVNLNHVETSRKYYQQSLAAYQQINDSSHIANEYLNIGLTYEKEGRHSTALDYYFKCLAIDEALNNQQGIASDYISIALIFKLQKDFPSAIAYYQKSLDLSNKLNDEYAVGMVLTNLGVIYKDEERYGQAMDAQQQALRTFEKFDDQRGVQTAQHNIAVIYFEQGEFAQSMQHLEVSLNKALRTNNGYAEVANETLKARIYFKQNRLKEAIADARKAYTMTAQLGLLVEHHEVVVLLSKIYEADGQPDAALQMLQKGIVLKDSIYNLDKARQMQELQTKYETAQKENQIALQQSELKRKSLLQKMTLAGVGLFILVGFIMARLYTSRQKQKRLLLDQQLENEKLEAGRLQELDEAKSRFFANIAHEFRTPLTLILGPSEQILEEDKNHRSVENAQMIQQNANKLLSLTNQLLDLSKLESGMVRLHPVKDDIIAFAKGCVHSFESLAEEKDVMLVFSSHHDRLDMDFDLEKTAIILNNLISNALKFTGPFGEVKVSIKSLGQPNAERPLEISVSDTGIGIPEQQLPYIFDRFYQVDDSQTRQAQGTGIGLALTKELTELHHGEITVSSAPGKGTCFTVRLPLNQEEKTLEKNQDIKGLVSDGESWAKNPLDKRGLSEPTVDFKKDANAPTVLVVEDNPDVRKFIVDILRNFYHTLEAENGRIGLEMTIEQVPDLVVSDVMMPEMDGHEYCRKIKEDERTSHIPVIMLTAKAGLESRIQGLDTGVDDYLAKPFNARELLARIKNLIKSRERLQKKYGQTNDPTLFAQKENAFIAKLKKVIDENLDREAFNVVDLGKALAMSRTQVHRKLKALTNLSTSQFIRQYKLDKAVGLLKSKERNVSEVAYMLGFNTPNYFSTCFTERFGYPPSDANKLVDKG